MPRKKKAPREGYEVLVGIDWPGHRAEPGEVRNDIPEKSIPWLLKQGLIRKPEEQE